MDVWKIGQGGQTNFDMTAESVKGIKSTQSIQDEKTRDEGTFKSANSNNKGQSDNNEEIKKAVDKLNKFLEDNKTHAVYEIHDKLKDVMIKIVDDKTNKVILEIPPKKILDMVSKMMEMVGLLVDKKA